MKCKYCQAELEDGVTVCPACGKEQEEVMEAATPAEEAPVEEAPVEEAPVEEAPVEEAPTDAMPAEEAAAEPAATEIKEGIKATPGKIALSIAAGIVVLALLVALVVSGIDGDLFQGTGETTAATDAAGTESVETVPPGTIPPDGNPEDVTCKGSYSVSEDELVASHDTVVAVVGDRELTVGQLQVYYWEYVYTFDSEYGTAALQFGLDLSRSLDTQLCQVGEAAITWQQYFLDQALKTWQKHQAVALAGQDAGYVLNDERQTAISELPSWMDESASYYGYETREAWLRDYVGPGCTTEDFVSYMSTFWHGDGYLEHLEKNTTFTADEVDAFFMENEGVYADAGITKESGEFYDVRHILVAVESSSEDGAATYSDEDWATCKAEAEKLLNQWLDGEATEDSFAALAQEKSADDGSKSNGGLYSYLTADTNFVVNFKEWYLDESRQVGDYGLVQSDYGYHIMYFAGSQKQWYAYAEADMISDAVSAAIPAAMEKYPMTVDYSAIKLGQLELVSG